MDKVIYLKGFLLPAPHCHIQPIFTEGFMCLCNQATLRMAVVKIKWGCIESVFNNALPVSSWYLVAIGVMMSLMTMNGFTFRKLNKGKSMVQGF